MQCSTPLIRKLGVNLAYRTANSAHCLLTMSTISIMATPICNNQSISHDSGHRSPRARTGCMRRPYVGRALRTPKSATSFVRGLVLPWPLSSTESLLTVGFLSAPSLLKQLCLRCKRALETVRRQPTIVEFASPTSSLSCLAWFSARASATGRW
jgi:hypothetical protein